MASTDTGAQGGGKAQPPESMTAITNAVQSDPTGLMFVSLVFEVAHHFVFQKMMYGPNNILRIDDKLVEQLVTVACKLCGGVDGVSVPELEK